MGLYSKAIGCGLLAPLVCLPVIAECYSYDELGRLTQTIFDSTGSPVIDYDLDEHGNRIAVETDAASSLPCSAPTGVADGGEASAVVSDEYDVPAWEQNLPPETDSEFIALNLNQSLTVRPLVGDVDPNGDTLAITRLELEPSLTGQISVVWSGGDEIVITAIGQGPNNVVKYFVTDGEFEVWDRIYVRVPYGGDPVTLPPPPPDGPSEDDCNIDPNLPGCDGTGGGDIPY